MAGRILLVLGLLAVWLIVLLPLKAVAIAAGGADRLGYDDVFGTVWNGRIYGLVTPGGRVREAAVSTRPAALLTGRLALDWQIADNSVSGRGRAALAPGGVTLDDVSLTVPLDRLVAAGRAGLDPDTPVFVRLAHLQVQDGQCRAAQGSLRSDALAAAAVQYGVEAPRLTGDIACRGDDLVLTLSGESADMSVDGEAVLRPGGYDWHVRVRTGHAGLADALALAGFAAREQDGTWHAEGRSSYGSNG